MEAVRKLTGMKLRTSPKSSVEATPLLDDPSIESSITTPDPSETAEESKTDVPTTTESEIVSEVPTTAASETVSEVPTTTASEIVSEVPTTTASEPTTELAIASASALSEPPTTAAAETEIPQASGGTAGSITEPPVNLEKEKQIRIQKIMKQLKDGEAGPRSRGIHLQHHSLSDAFAKIEKYETFHDSESGEVGGKKEGAEKVEEGEKRPLQENVKDDGKVMEENKGQVQAQSQGQGEGVQVGSEETSQGQRNGRERRHSSETPPADLDSDLPTEKGLPPTDTEMERRYALAALAERKPTIPPEEQSSRSRTPSASASMSASTTKYGAISKPETESRSPNPQDDLEISILTGQPNQRPSYWTRKKNAVVNYTRQHCCSVL